jgi:hypothetical protein
MLCDIVIARHHKEGEKRVLMFIYVNLIKKCFLFMASEIYWNWEQIKMNDESNDVIVFSGSRWAGMSLGLTSHGVRPASFGWVW